MKLTVHKTSRKNLLHAGGVLATGGLSSLITFFDWGAHCNVIGNPLGLLLPFIIRIIFIAWCVEAMRYAASNIKRDLKFSLLLLLITAGATFTTLFMPLGFMGYQHRLQTHAEEYASVINLVKQGDISPNEYGFALLPVEYRQLSRCGGEIMIDQTGSATRILFFIYRDMFDDFAGYLYRSDKLTPQPDDFSARPNRLRSWSSFKPFQPHWFFVNNT